ncbi:MAG: hypothetical protein Q4615_03375 [Paracoccus aminovorans]|nr:hypothetical protein [Paracoccus aminovorans]
MSAWLSAANGIMAPARGQIMAEMQKSQQQMMLEWQKLWIESWMALWFPGAAKGRKW